MRAGSEFCCTSFVSFFFLFINVNRKRKENAFENKQEKTSG